MNSKSYNSKNGVVIETTTSTEERILSLNEVDKKIQSVQIELYHWQELKEDIIKAKENFTPEGGPVGK